MDIKDRYMLLGFFIGLLFAAVVGYIVDKTWRDDAASHGFAEYNQTNGNWQWKEGGK